MMTGRKWARCATCKRATYRCAAVRCAMTRAERAQISALIDAAEDAIDDVRPDDANAILGRIAPLIRTGEWADLPDDLRVRVVNATMMRIACEDAIERGAFPLAYADGSPVKAPAVYRIVRFRWNAGSRTTRTGLTLRQAQRHCARPDTSSHSTGPGSWFDGFDYMAGFRPKGA